MVCLSVNYEDVPEVETEKTLGCDRGQNNLAVVAPKEGFGKFFNGQSVKHRRRYFQQRKQLQEAKKFRALKKWNKKEQRWMEAINHTVSRRIVRFGLCFMVLRHPSKSSITISALWYWEKSRYVMTKINIVLVEDHDLTRVGLRTALQQDSNIKIVGEAANGKKGLEILKQTQPDIAIIDIGLPDMDGIELTQKFKQHIASSGARETKVLILTMHDNEDAVMGAFAAGADSYSVKDVSLDKLKDAIHTTYEGNAWIDPVIARTVLKQVKNKQPDITTPGDQKTVMINAVEPEYQEFLKSCPLTERELEVLELIVAGRSNAEIAEKLYITVGTVKTHVRSILNKLCADDRTQAAVRALRSGWID